MRIPIKPRVLPLMGRVPRGWQAVEECLGTSGPRVRAARRRCRQFLAEDITQGRRPDLQGGGLRRSAGGWEGHPALRRGHEGWTSPTSPLGRFGLGAGEGRRAAARPGALEGAASFGETAEKAERVAKLYPAYSEPAN